MKKFYFLLIYLFFFSSLQVFSAEGCEYIGKRDECIEANKNGTTKSIEEYVCPQTTSAEEILYQIIFDEKFKEYDEEMLTYLDWLEQNKNYYFWEEKQENFLEGINGVTKKFWVYGEYYEKYLGLCWPKWKIIQDFLACVWRTSFDESKEYFKTVTCESLANKKISIAKETAYNVLKLNKMQIRKDDKKEYFQERRSAYDRVLDLIMVNLGYIERIWKKWPSKIKDNMHK